MNRAVSRTLILRIWNIFSGIIAVGLVPFFLDPTAQGLYFSFASVIAIQIFFELGLGQVLLYRFADLHTRSTDGHSLDTKQLRTLLSTARIIYKYMAALFFVVALFSGLYFFGSIPLKGIAWQMPWLALVLATSINLLQSIKLGYLEAIGEMHHVSVARLRSNVIGAILFSLILVSGGGLWAACAIPAGNAFYMTYWLYAHRNAGSYLCARKVEQNNLKASILMWKKEVLPMQWRVSLCWVSGFFMYQLYAPVTLIRFGPVVSGRLGIIVSVMSSLLFVATTFTSAIAPRLSALYSSGRIKEYNKEFDKSALASSLSLAVACLMVPLLIWLMSIFGLAFAERFLSFEDALIYALCTIASGLLYILSVYLRSQQKEPFLRLSIYSALLTPPVLIIASSGSLYTMLLAALALNIGSLAWGAKIYSDKRASLS